MHSAFTRRRLLRTALATTASGGVAGCLSTDGRAEGTATGGSGSTGRSPSGSTGRSPSRSSPSPRERPHFSAYLPAATKRSPTTADGRFGVFRPAACLGRDGFGPLSSVLRRELAFLPAGVEMRALARTVLSPSLTVHAGCFSGGDVVDRMVADGATVAGNYRGYRLVERARRLVAVADRSCIAVRNPRLGLSRQRTLLARTIDRRRADVHDGEGETDARDGGRSGPFGRVTALLSSDLLWRVEPEPLAATGFPDGYPALVEDSVPLQLVGQSVGRAGQNLRGTTVVAVDGSPESYRRRLAESIRAGGDLGYFAYESPTVEVVDGVVRIRETRDPEPLVRE